MDKKVSDNIEYLLGQIEAGYVDVSGPYESDCVYLIKSLIQNLVDVTKFAQVLKSELNPYTGDHGVGFTYERMCEFIDSYLSNILGDAEDGCRKDT